MTEHKVGTREEWQVARKALLEREKELTHRGDEMARERRELPWVRVDKEYSFETDEGTKTLAELFDGRSQLLVYHFMFGPEYTAGCPVCSSAADTFDGAVQHLKARDVTFLCVSRAPLERLQAYKRRMGWKFPWASSQGTDFNFNFDVSATEEQLAPFLEGDVPPVVAQLAAACGTDPAGYLADQQGLGAFALSDGVVYHTYSSYARGVEIVMGFYPLLDRVPKGRNEGGSTEFWIRRHDEYEDVGAGRTG
ncbi:MAG: DUF899 domain-containing protein [Actinomycetota bacterium]|nr:DUF899 domain-containing protein [Actinomycetota bacterium]